MTILTNARGGASDARGADHALPHASIGTVPILWYAAVDPAQRWRAATILDEIARLGFDGTQSGEDFPEGATLRSELARRRLRLAEVYVPIPTTVDGPTARAMSIATDSLARLHDAGGEVLVVAVDGSPDRDACAGRVDDLGAPALTDSGWAALVGLLHEIADAARALGHPMVFHPHAATYIETAGEIDRLLRSTDPERVGICLDTGHHLVAGADPAADLLALGERVRHVHLKDVDPDILAGLRAGAYAGLADAVRHGLFTELGSGSLDLAAVLAALADRSYDGWLMIEQDRSLGSPSESAAIGRRALDASLRGLDALRDEASTA